ncbi:MAG TPA: threonine dehydratase [Actinomycetota bacterium]|nr:threonine dehydratase [Actinomycetota bacterium]
MLTSAALHAAADTIDRFMPPTPTMRWPLLDERVGMPVWVKHENHNPTGAFKVRGGLRYLARSQVEDDSPTGIVSASRGNHAQSLAFAGAAFRTPVVIVVPEGNSPDKDAATRAMGAEVVVHGKDFQSSLEHAYGLARERGYTLVPPFHQWLLEGVATYAAELYNSVPGLDTVYVPVGMGTGICANISVRDLFECDTEIVGVVAAKAPAYALSFEYGALATTPTAATFVDGVACRVPDPAALDIILRGASRFITVSEQEAAEAMVLMYRCTHNLAEPAGSLALAGLLKDREQASGKKVAVVHTGGNVDFDVLAGAFAACE